MEPDERYKQTIAPLLERRAELRRQEIAVSKAIEHVNLAWGLPLRYGLDEIEGAVADKSTTSSVPVGGGRFRNMSQPRAVYAAIEYIGHPVVAREILACLEEDGAAPTGSDPVKKVQVALNRRAKTEKDVLHVGDGMWALTTWYTPTELEKYRQAENPAGARDKAEHARRMSEGIRKSQARGAHYGNAPKLTAEMWNLAMKMLRDEGAAISQTYREIIKLTPPGTKPMHYNVLRLYSKRIKAGEPYPANWKAYYESHPIKESDEPSVRRDLKVVK
jgi:hypothetical protein